MASNFHDTPENSDPDPAGEATLGNLGQDVHQLWQDVTEQVKAIVEIVFLEGKLAVSSLSVILIAAAFLSGLALTTWGFLVAAIVLALVQSGVSLALTMLICALVNALLAVGSYLVIRRVARNLNFRASRQMIFGEEDD